MYANWGPALNAELSYRRERMNAAAGRPWRARRRGAPRPAVPAAALVAVALPEPRPAADAAVAPALADGALADATVGDADPAPGGSARDRPPELLRCA